MQEIGAAINDSLSETEQIAIAKVRAGGSGLVA